LHAGGGQCAFARILLGNEVRKCGIYSIICTTHEAELRFRFSYLQLSGLYSKSPKLAFNQWVAGSSPTRLITHLKSKLSHPTTISKDAKMTNYDDIFQTWIREKEILDRCSARTIDSYRDAWSAYKRYQGCTCELTKARVKTFAINAVNAKLTPRTINSYASGINSFLSCPLCQYPLRHFPQIV